MSTDPPPAGAESVPSLTPEDAAALERCLTGDGVALIPTDTVYGLAYNPNSQPAMRRVYELKQRPPLKPVAVMFFALDQALGALPELGPRTRAALGALLPAPVTFLLPNPEHRFQLACNPTGDLPEALGIRVPVLDGPLTALANVNAPAAQSSANLSGHPDPRCLDDVPLKLREDVDLALDGGELPGTSSTVIDLSEYERHGRWQIVREGPLERTALETLLG